MAKNLHNAKYNPHKSQFINEIRSRLADGKDVVVLVIGGRRMGKSIRSIRLAEEIEPDFKVGSYPPGKDGANFFTIPHCMKYMENEGDKLDRRVVTLQELGVAVYRRNFAKEGNKIFNMVMQMIGYRQICFIWTLPSLSFIDNHSLAMAHFIVLVNKLDRKNGYAICEVKRIQHNAVTGKTYKPTYRFFEKGKARSTILKGIAIGLPTKKNFDAYNQADKIFKDEFMSKSLKRFEAAEAKEEKAG